MKGTIDTTPWTLRLPTHFYDADTDEGLGDLEEPLHLEIGEGLIWGRDAERYRVVDRWVSMDKHGRLDVGVHVWLRKLATRSEDDRPGRAHPDYYVSE